jgi:acyl carrier protein
MMNLDTLLRALETMLGRTGGSITVDSRLDALDWDSMSELSFIAMADSKLDVRVAAGAVTECETVGDLVRLLGPAVTP